MALQPPRKRRRRTLMAYSERMPYMPPPVRWGQPNLAERRSSGSSIAVEEALREDRSEEQPTTSGKDSSATEPEVQQQERDAEEKLLTWRVSPYISALAIKWLLLSLTFGVGWFTYAIVPLRSSAVPLKKI